MGGFLEFVVFAGRHWRSLLGFLGLGILAASLVNLVQPRVYQATAVSYVKVTTAGGASPTDLAAVADLAQNRIPTYLVLAATPEVNEGVANALQVPGVTSSIVADSLTYSHDPDSLLISITARGPEAPLARDLANEGQKRLGMFVQSLEQPPRGVRPSAVVSLQPVSSARAPVQASEPRVARNVAVGAAAGLTLGVLITLGRFLRFVFGGRGVDRVPKHAREGDVVSIVVAAPSKRPLQRRKS